MSSEWHNCSIYPTHCYIQILQYRDSSSKCHSVHITLLHLYGITDAKMPASMLVSLKKVITNETILLCAKHGFLKRI